MVLPAYLEPLRRLLPLAPELADLDGEQLRLLRLATVALVLNTDDEQIVDTLREQLAEELGDRLHLVWTRVDDGGIGCLVVFPHRHQEAVRALLGRAQVRQAALPEAFERLSLRAAVEAIERRLAELPQAISSIRAEREALLLPHAAPTARPARRDRRRARAARRGRRFARDAARVRRRVLGAPARAGAAARASSTRVSEPRCSSRTSRPLREIRRRRC